MTSFAYKNQLFIERASSHSNYFYQNMNITFEEQNIPFHYKSPLDKIIFCFDRNISDNNKIEYLDPSFDLNVFKHENSNINVIGIIKIYSDGPSIKIYYIKFYDENLIKINLITFKEYLIKSIMDINLNDSQIDSSNFSVYWEQSILTDKIKNIAKYIGLFFENFYGTFIFTSNNIKEFYNNILELKLKDPEVKINSSTNSFSNPTTNSFSNPTTSTTNSFSNPTTNSFSNPTTSTNSFSNPSTSTTNSFSNPSTSTNFFSNPSTSTNFFSNPSTNSFTYNSNPTTNSLSSTKPLSGFNSFTASGFSNGLSGKFKK